MRAFSGSIRHMASPDRDPQSQPVPLTTIWRPAPAALHRPSYGGHLPLTQDLLRQLEDVPEWLESDPGPHAKWPPGPVWQPHSTAQCGWPCRAVRPGADGGASEGRVHPLLQVPALGLAAQRGLRHSSERKPRGGDCQCLLQVPAVCGLVSGWYQNRLDRVGSRN